MRRRLKLSLIVGFAISLSFHVASGIITAVYPYPDSPTTPPLIFFFLLEVGWVLSGQPWPLFLVWRELIAFGINGVVYSLLVFGLLAIWKWSGKAE